MIDTLEYSQELIDAGVSENIAKVQAKALNRAVEKGTATKEDIAKLGKEIQRVELELKGDIKLTRWMVGFCISLNVLIIGILLSPVFKLISQTQG